MKSRHIINKDITLLEALTRINSLEKAPLVLFVIDGEGRMVGTLTDGDSRRALIGGASVGDKVEQVMHRQFRYIKEEDAYNVAELKRQRELGITLMPIVDDGMRIVDILNLQQRRSRLPIDAVLMAGGKGERLRPLTEATPKPLLPVGGKAIIDHNVDRLIDFGVEHISVTVNYLKEQIEEHYREPRGGVQVQTVREPKYLGTIGSVRFVTDICHDTVLVMNSDLFTDIDYEDFYLHFQESQADMAVAAVPYNVNIPYGILDLDGGDVIKGLSEKPTYDYYANAGIYLVKQEVLDRIPQDAFYNATDFILILIAQGGKVVRYPHTGLWIDIGNIQEYRRANDLMKNMQL